MSGNTRPSPAPCRNLPLAAAPLTVRLVACSQGKEFPNSGSPGDHQAIRASSFNTESHPSSSASPALAGARDSVSLSRCTGSCCLVPGCGDTGTSASPGGKSMESRRLPFKILGGNAIFSKLGRCQCVLPAQLTTLTWRSEARPAAVPQLAAQEPRNICSGRAVPRRSSKAGALGGHRTPWGCPRRIESITKGVVTAPQGFCPVAQSCGSKANGSGAR